MLELMDADDTPIHVRNYDSSFFEICSIYFFIMASMRLLWTSVQMLLVWRICLMSMPMRPTASRIPLARTWCPFY